METFVIKDNHNRTPKEAEELREKLLEQLPPGVTLVILPSGTELVGQFKAEKTYTPAVLK